MIAPRFIIAALKGGSGKTLLSIGLLAALREGGVPVVPFKKGPDYIDAGWLTLAAKRPCYNLDTFLCEPETIQASFCSHMTDGSVALIEGNRGLFDGIDLAGGTSTAELAKLLRLPIILCVDCTKTTRTMAAMIKGCQIFDPEVQISGIVLNQVAGPRHRNIVTHSIEHHCGIPVVGAIPKLRQENFPERHMGLTPSVEHPAALAAIKSAAKAINEHVDKAAILAIAQKAAPIEATKLKKATPTIDISSSPQTRIGVLKDAAFQFYYPDNLEALESAGAKLVYISPLSQTTLPSVDALYLGGGFPETHVEQLAGNDAFRREIKLLADSGMPIYAECGGLIYLGQSLVISQKAHQMAGVLPLSFSFSKRPQGHGYTILKVSRPNPYFEVGTEIKGHEFHYSSIAKWEGEIDHLVMDMERGVGILEKREGFLYKNVLALYTHIHALGTPQWAGALVKTARQWRAEQHIFDKK